MGYYIMKKYVFHIVTMAHEYTRPCRRRVIVLWKCLWLLLGKSKIPMVAGKAGQPQERFAVLPAAIAFSQRDRKLPTALEQEKEN